MKVLTLMITLALLNSVSTFADDSELSRDERNACDGYPETCQQNSQDDDDISLYYGRMERNAQDAQEADPGEQIGKDGLPAFCHFVDPYKAYGSRVDNECIPKLDHPTILFNQKWEIPAENQAHPNEEGPGFVPVKHCVTGELVSLYKYQQDCGVPVHSECRSIGKDKNGQDIVSCK